MKGTVVVLSMIFFYLILTYFTSVLPLTAPSMLLPKVIVCDKIFIFLSEVFFVFFFEVSPVLPISFSRNDIPGKYKYSNI